MYCEAVRIGLEAGQVLSGQEVAKRGLTYLWGEGGLIMVIDQRAPEFQAVSFRVMTEEEHRREVQRGRSSSVSDMPGP